jgi:hypothetical protein
MAADEWSRRPVPVVARLIEISAAFGSWWVKSKLHNTPQLAAADMRNVSPLISCMYACQRMLVAWHLADRSSVLLLCCSSSG